jgi:hypothetical protein
MLELAEVALLNESIAVADTVYAVEVLTVPNAAT